MEIKIDDVTKTYGDVTALDDVSFDVERGSTFGLLGTNGAGKTTLIKLLVGLDRPDDGRIRIGETDVATAGRTVRELVGYLPQRIGFPSKLTGREVLRFTARTRRIPKAKWQERVPDVLDTVGLAGAADRNIGGYSGGMRRRLGLATAILNRPPVLILDEPTAGLDPEGVAEYHHVIEEITDRTDSTVLFSSHVLSEVESLCDSVAVLHGGELRASGTVEGLTESVGSGVTVRMRVDDVGTAATIARRHGDVSTSDDSVVVELAEASVSDLIGDINETVDVAGVDVERPGLETIFHDAVEIGDIGEVPA
ncbi:ABC transporter ATP-binding protein [Natronomonas sp. LN261]|jgi:Cu-processing system ATP-binding protein|uniref:ABC transporter ATP-binding protein n=1 Tax=Natronomonas sp. LN261 TaxID=2750669 RepID=UPI0015EFB2F6|nr:ABC transporter ATP-binding protein [Natronomonas sp. LN261]